MESFNYKEYTKKLADLNLWFAAERMRRTVNRFDQGIRLNKKALTEAQKSLVDVAKAAKEFSEAIQKHGIEAVL